MLRIENTADVHQIQILSHEFKVCLAQYGTVPYGRQLGLLSSFGSFSASSTAKVDLCMYPEQIASKVELHVGLQSGEGISWKRLGSFAFDSNDRSKLQARELKSVTVSVQALFIRIVLARCHLNSQNIYKQVPSRWSLCAPISAETGI